MRAWQMVTILLLLSVAGCPARACSCAGRPVCGALKPSDTMFLGKVIRLTYEGGSPYVKVSERGFRKARRTFTFAVLETFSGAQRVGEEIDVETGGGDGDCGYNFVVGDRYFVDAEVWAGKLSTSICLPTAPEWDAAILLRELRTAASGGRSPDLSGLVLKTIPGANTDTEKPTPLSGLPVIATSAEGVTYPAITDAQGIYGIARLPAGKYTISFELPSGFMAARYQRKPVEITVPPSSGAEVACHANFNASPSGSIPGEVVDLDNKPLPGEIFVCPFAAAGQPASCAGTAEVKQDGSFDVAPLAAGTYTLEFRLYNDYRRVTYYPGTKDKSKAQLITVPDGKATPPLHFVVTP